VKVLAEVRHPHVLDVHKVWVQEDTLIVIMELAENSLMDRWHKAREMGVKGIGTSDLLPFMVQVATGLDYLESVGIRHGNVKPQNLLLIGDQVKVSDFGISKLLTLTIASNLRAITPAYAAPEVFSGETSPTADQYSLAVTYCHLRGGRLPFEAVIAAQMMLRHVMHKPDLTMIPEHERPVIARALAKTPEERWASCEEFVAALTAALQGRAFAGTSPEENKENFRQKRREEKRFEKKDNRKFYRFLTKCIYAIAVIVPLGIAIFALGFYWLTRHRVKPQPTTKATVTQTKTSEPRAKRKPTKELDSLVLDLGMGTTMEFIGLPSDSFLLGSPETDDQAKANEMPQHLINISEDFFIAVAPVTRAQFARFVEAENYQTEAEKDGLGGTGYDPKTNQFLDRQSKFTWRDPGFQQDDNHPVVNVSWNDAQAFCEWMSRKTQRYCSLPREAEWEYSCRADSTTRYFSGDDPATLKGFANVGDQALKAKRITARDAFAYFPFDDGYPFTSPVGTFKANPYLLEDICGNVWQWCRDWYGEGYYADCPKIDPEGPEAGKLKVLRGGSWVDEPGLCRAAARGAYEPSFRGFNVGFRVRVRVNSNGQIGGKAAR
jgi:formylglycine-generating enzyme required for sulfatase activity